MTNCQKEGDVSRHDIVFDAVWAPKEKKALLSSSSRGDQSSCCWRKDERRRQPSRRQVHCVPVHKDKRISSKSYIQLDCPSVTNWDVRITFAVEVRFQIRAQFWIPQPKQHGVWYLVFVVKPQTMLVWLVTTKRCFAGGFRHKIGPLSSNSMF